MIKTDKYGDDYREVCTACGKPCDGVVVDLGVGLTEAWGSSFAHTDERYVSKCCERDIDRDYDIEAEEVGSA